jgi:hypothetical protein
MSSVKDLGDQWERELIAEIRARRDKHVKAAEGCKPHGEYRAQIMRIVAMMDRMIVAIDPCPAVDGWNVAKCPHGIPREDRCDECDDGIEQPEPEEADDGHCHACNDTGEGAYGDTRCTECPTKKGRNQDEP